MRALRRNLAYKILSLALGILLYAVAFQQNNPRTSQEIIIQPEPERLPGTLAIKKRPDSVTVTVTGNAAAIQAFKQQTIKAAVDLSRAEEGVNRVPIRYRQDPGLIDLTGPAFAEVTLEKNTSKDFVIEPQYNNAPPAGFEYEDATTQPRRARVKGPESDIKRVASVVALVDNNGPFIGPVELAAQNKNSESVEGVEIEPKQAMVTLKVRTAPATKTLLLSPQWSGTAAAGFTITNYDFDPRLVTVAGTPTQLANRSRIPVPLSVDGLKESVTRTVTLTAPPGMSFVEPKDGRITVRLDISSIALPAPATAPPPASPTPRPPQSTPAPQENP